MRTDSERQAASCAPTLRFHPQTSLSICNCKAIVERNVRNFRLTTRCGKASMPSSLCVSVRALLTASFETQGEGFFLCSRFRCGSDAERRDGSASIRDMTECREMKEVTRWPFTILIVRFRWRERIFKQGKNFKTK